MSVITLIGLLLILKGPDKRKMWKWKVEHLLYPAFKSSLCMPKQFEDDGTILKIADLKELYKVFERC